jgi:hypothetical protein
LPSKKASCALPTVDPVAPPGLPSGGKGMALNGGPEVNRIRSPVYELNPLLVTVATIHIGVWSTS